MWEGNSVKNSYGSGNRWRVPYVWGCHFTRISHSVVPLQDDSRCVVTIRDYMGRPS